jgi:tripartite-type tricarboxylate transporter receptor subunit TctC
MRRRGLLAAPFVVQAGAGPTTLLLPRPAAAQGWMPDRALRLVVPYPAGGGTDVFARRVAARLGPALGQPIVVENRTGASGAIGVAEVLRSRADGLTLLFGGASTHAILPLVAVPPPYDPLRDLASVALVGANSVCVAVRPEVAADLPALVARARREPGQLRYGHPGNGTFVHLASMATRLALGGIDLLAVPYRGNGPAMTDLLAGSIEGVMDTLATTLEHHRQGRIRILAVCSTERSPLAPEVPTVAEVAPAPGFEASLWNVLAVRAGTPAPVITALHAAAMRALGTAEAQAELRAAAIEPASWVAPAVIDAFVRRESARWAPIVAAAEVRLE